MVKITTNVILKDFIEITIRQLVLSSIIEKILHTEYYWSAILMTICTLDLLILMCIMLASGRKFLFEVNIIIPMRWKHEACKTLLQSRNY
jgi:hypothetical protein